MNTIAILLCIVSTLGLAAYIVYEYFRVVKLYKEMAGKWFDLSIENDKLVRQVLDLNRELYEMQEQRNILQSKT